MTLAERIVALHRSLVDAGIPHAFGGAISLAYWTLEPRGTRDLDLNVFLPASEVERALAGLPEDVAVGPKELQAIERDGQARVWWQETPLDLFFDNLPIHKQAAKHSRVVPFEGTEIPVVGPVELAVFKVMFDRTRDWADIEAMMEAKSLDVDAVRAALAPMLEADDPRFDRLSAVVARGRELGE